MRITGIARVDRRTKNLLHRVAPGDVAIISHTDLDAPCASALVQHRVAAVINAQRSLSGRFPHPGPGIVVRAGIPLIDQVGEEIMERVREGQRIEIMDGAIYANGDCITHGAVLTETDLNRQLEESRNNTAKELARFVENTLSYVSQEKALLLEPSQLPRLRTPIEGRHCLIVVRGPGAAGDIRTIRSYIRALDPVLIGVDGGADLLLHEGYRPDVIIGDMDSVSDETLSCGAELVVHAYPNGDAPGRERLEKLNLPYVILSSRGTSEDIAMLLAYEKRAELIAAVGTHFSLSEFLEKSRGGMSSTFLVRLRVGSILVDAKGISRLYPPGPSRRLFFYMAAVAATIMFVLVTTSPAIRASLDLWFLRLIHFFRSFQ